MIVRINSSKRSIYCAHHTTPATIAPIAIAAAAREVVPVVDPKGAVAAGKGPVHGLGRGRIDQAMDSHGEAAGAEAGLDPGLVLQNL